MYRTLVQLRRTALQGWASISSMIDIIIAGAMVWSVSGIQLTAKAKQNSFQTAEVEGLVHLIIGTGVLTGK